MFRLNQKVTSKQNTYCLVLAANCFALATAMASAGFGSPIFCQSTASDTAALIRNGQASLAHSDLGAAQAAFEQAVHQSPNSEPAQAALGALYLQKGDGQNAVRTLAAARALNRADLNTELNLGMAYQQEQQQAKALPLFADGIGILQRSKQAVPPQIRAAYARALAANDKLPQATAEMSLAAKADPKNATLIGDLGALYAQRGDWPHAEIAFRSQLAQQPDAALAHLRLGLAMQAQSKPNALTEFQTAARLAPDDATVESEFGKALVAANDDVQAIAAFQRALSIQPNSPSAQEELAEAYQRTEHVAEAVELFQKILIAEPNSVRALTNLGAAYTQMQQAKQAVPYLQRAVKLKPDDVTALQDLAAAYIVLSQFGDAVTELRAALKLAPQSAQLHYNLGFALKGQDDIAAAIPELQKAEQLEPNAPEAPYVLGVLYMQAGRYAEASPELQKSLRLRSENGDGWATLGSVYNKLDLLPEAVDALHHAIQQLPSASDPHLTLAAVLAKQGKTQEAVAERKIAAGLMSKNMNRQRAEVATNAGNSALKNGDVDGALQQFKDAVSYDPAFADAYLGLAKVYESQGHAAEAAAERAKAASLQ